MNINCSMPCFTCKTVFTILPPKYRKFEKSKAEVETSTLSKTDKCIQIIIYDVTVTTPYENKT